MEIKTLLQHKPRGKKGEGRKVNFTPVNVPIDVAADLKLYRDIYSELLSERFSFESMFRHWMSLVAIYDPDVQAAFDKAKQSREDFASKMADGLGITVEQLKANEAAYDPTNAEEEPWKLKYIFEKDGEEIEAHPGNKAAFYAKINGRNVGIKSMLADGWTLMNEIGVELDYEQAVKICALIKKNSEK